MTNNKLGPIQRFCCHVAARVSQINVDICPSPGGFWWPLCRCLRAPHYLWPCACVHTGWPSALQVCRLHTHYKWNWTLVSFIILSYVVYKSLCKSLSIVEYDQGFRPYTALFPQPAWSPMVSLKQLTGIKCAFTFKRLSNFQKQLGTVVFSKYYLIRNN